MKMFIGQVAAAFLRHRIEIIVVVTIGVAGLVPTPARANTPTSPSTPTKVQQIAYHLDRGKKLWEDNDTDGAVAEWKQVLKLDPENAEAKELLSEAGVSDAPLQSSTAMPTTPAIPVDPVKHHQEIVAGCRDALQRYAKADSLTDMADVLEDTTADTLARTLMLSYRDAIGTFLDRSNPADPDFSNDYENFLDSSGLSTIIEIKESGGNPGYSTTRMHGRAFLAAFAPWVTRAEKSKLFLYYRHPDGWADSAISLDQDTFLETPTGTVLLDGPALEDGVALEAKYEDGKWRIGSRPGQQFNFDIHIDYPRRLSHK